MGLLDEVMKPFPRGWFSKPVTEFEKKYIFGLLLCALVVIPLCFIILAAVHTGNIPLLGVGIVYSILQAWVTISAWEEFTDPYRTVWASFCGLRGDIGYLKGFLYGLCIAVVTIIAFGVFGASITDYKLIEFSGMSIIPPAYHSIPIMSTLGGFVEAFVLCFIIPWIEESYFRAMVVCKLAELFGSVLAILGSAIIFTVFHLFVYAHNIPVLVVLFIMSILAAIPIIKWRTYLPGLVAHIIINTLAYLSK